MEFFIIFFSLWYPIGYCGSLFVIYKATSRINLEDVLTNLLWASVLGPILTLIMVAVYFGNKTIYQKK